MNWKQRPFLWLLYLVGIAVCFGIGYWLRDVIGP